MSRSSQKVQEQTENGDRSDRAAKEFLSLRERRSSVHASKKRRERGSGRERERMRERKERSGGKEAARRERSMAEGDGRRIFLPSVCPVILPSHTDFKLVFL